MRTYKKQRIIDPDHFEHEEIGHNKEIIRTVTETKYHCFINYKGLIWEVYPRPDIDSDVWELNCYLKPSKPTKGWLTLTVHIKR